MKIILIILLSTMTISANCQIFKTTGPDLQPQYTQLQKTNDSLKTVLNYYVNVIIKSITQQIYDQKNQLKTKSDSITLLKTQYNKCRYQIFSDTIDFIGFSDTIVGTYTKISERTYEVTPKFTLQVLQRYPIKIGTAIKTKEVTVTEINQ